MASSSTIAIMELEDQQKKHKESFYLKLAELNSFNNFLELLNYVI